MKDEGERNVGDAGSGPPSEMEGFVRQGLRDTMSGVRIFLKVAGTVGLLALLGMYVASGFHTVSPNEVGLLERLGRLEGAPLSPGFHLTLPWPFDRVTKLPVKTVHRLSIDSFQAGTEEPSKPSPDEGSGSADPNRYRYVLSGDNNILNLQATVLYTIINPADYRYSLADDPGPGGSDSFRDREELLRGLCCTALVHALSGKEVDRALTGGKRDIEESVRAQLQARLSELSCGVGVTFVELKHVSPPASVTEYFNDVVKAKIDRQKYVNDAESYRNESLSTAEALAEERVQGARSYANEVVEKSKGESERFIKQWKEYRQSREITRYRLYLDFIGAVGSRITHKLIHVRDGKRDVARIRIRIGEKGD